MPETQNVLNLQHKKAPGSTDQNKNMCVCYILIYIYKISVSNNLILVNILKIIMLEMTVKETWFNKTLQTTACGLYLLQEVLLA